ncbi:hypothetical protein K2173_019539 [Erythroxylum novogranatense]|uniref:Uncharacterized protein n=1 Tax=Erythroxylum novogranatense TaxID=1862640 RepID=A0AAV8UEC6_9ROSI|nr:hypothetical protein K2173_019539 [Erythroxylum novogranatense]
MEGLIPFVYKVVMQYKTGKEDPFSTWLCESPSPSYTRLPGDSGRFQAADPRRFGSDYAFIPASSNMNSTGTQIVISTGAQSPLCRLTSRRVAT